MGRGNLMPYLVFIVAVFLSAISAYYSVMGMVAIFAASPVAVALMASGLEAAKLVTASWLYRNWVTAPMFLKSYLSIATAILMLITSMGCFGFLSKAHSDQNLVGGDVISKVQAFDDQIKTSKENIEANRKALKQMDEGIDQILARSDDSRGAEMAVSLRRGQAKERQRLLGEIDNEQKEISRINQLASPIRAEVRKVEAEIGPIKYIAKLIYGDNPDANILEKAVTWVILLLISVFDPLAVLLLIAASISFAQRAGVEFVETESIVSKLKGKFEKVREKIKEVSDSKPEVITKEDFENDPILKESSEKSKEIAKALDNGDALPLSADEVTWPSAATVIEEMPAVPFVFKEEPIVATNVLKGKEAYDMLVEAGIVNSDNTINENYAEMEPLVIDTPDKSLTDSYKTDIIKEYVSGEQVTPLPKPKRKYKKKPKLEVAISEPVVTIEKDEAAEKTQPTTALNKTKKVVADEKETVIPDDLEEIYKDIVTELTAKKTKKGGWFPETTKLKNE
jgi:hypothetical protein